MSMSSEWTLTIPFEGAWLQLSASIPRTEVVSDSDAKFIDSLREQMLDQIAAMIAARKAAAEAGASDEQGE